MTKIGTHLKRERVLRTAMCMADQGGIEAVSMRKLAQELGVQAMSLYNHIANKDDLLDGMVELIISEIEVPDQSIDWQKAMWQRATSAHSVLLNHPWAVMAIMSRINKGPAMLRYADATLGCLHQAGFSPEMADHAWNAIDSHIYGFTLQELNFPIEAVDYATMARDYQFLIPAEQYPHLNRLSQQIISGAYDGMHDFELGLELIINGLDQLLKKMNS